MAKTLTIKEKILAFLKESGIKKIDFFEATGIQSSNFKGANLKSAPGSDMVVKILSTYPELSADWLMRGEGDMLKTKHISDSSPHSMEPHFSPKVTDFTTNSQLNPSLLNHLLELMSKKDIEIGRLQERVDQLEREKNGFEESFQAAQRELSKSTVDS